MANWHRFITDICSLSLAGLTTADVTAIKKSILDTLAVTWAGALEPVARPVAELAALSSGPCTVVGLGRRVAPETAALCNGILAHALDFDDANVVTSMHPSAPLVPALLAVSELAGASGAALISAYAAGLTGAARIGQVAGRPMYAQGWHTTGTLGALAAALGAAHLLGLDPERTRHCLGIACSGASGLKENFGTMAKPFNAGNAARMGVTAALLARAGFTASAEAMDGRQGFLRVYLPHTELAWSETWPEIRPAECLQLKKYPSCWGTHPILDYALEWRAQSGQSWRDIHRITVAVSPVTAANLRFPRPRTGLEGKFSLHYTLALALQRGAVTMADFTDAAVADTAALAELSDRIHLEEGDGFIPGQRHCRVAIRSRHGQEWAVERARARGDPPDVLSWDELLDKTRQCAVHAGLDPASIMPVVQMVQGLEQLPDVRALTNCLHQFRPGGGVR